jgi:hypothetical protein
MIHHKRQPFPRVPLKGIFSLRLVSLLTTISIYCTGCQPFWEPANSISSLNAPTNGQHLFHLNETGGSIDLLISYGDVHLPDELITKWVQTSANAVSTYFGTFPVRRVTISVVEAGEGNITEGVTTGEGIHVKLGRNMRQADFEQDWVMTHEMFHLAFPSMDDEYVWLQEGLASYLEPLARNRVGWISPKEVWRGYVQGMPQGQPRYGDRGLDRTHTWGRTYWGGSMFCLLADLRIREQTHNRHSLDDAMRCILAKGGDHMHLWTMQRVIDVGDQATGTHVLRELYAEMGNRPVTIDLEDLWRRVGVEVRSDGEVIFNDNAPLAQVRKAMTKPFPVTSR